MSCFEEIVTDDEDDGCRFHWPPGYGLVKALLNQGYTKSDFAVEFKKSHGAISYIFKKYGIQYVRPWDRPEFREKFKQLIRKHIQEIENAKLARG